MNSANILIVEDEFIIAIYLKTCLEDHGFHVVEIVDCYDDAISTLENNDIDIVLLDIKISGDKTGIDIAHTINSKYKKPFIYLTSYSDEKTLSELKSTLPKGFVSKPINDKDLVTTVAIVNNNRVVEYEEESVNELDVQLEINDFILLKKVNEYHKVFYKDIIYLKVEGIYSRVYTPNGTFLSSKKLIEYEKSLPTKKFIRTHRSCIVNFDHLVSINTVDSIVTVSNSDVLPLSRAQRQVLVSHLNLK